MEEILNQILEEMKAGFKEVNGKIDALQEQVVSNSESISTLQADVTAIKDNQQTIMQIQQDQQNTQDLLAARSITQEAVIKEIKRIK